MRIAKPISILFFSAFFAFQLFGAGDKFEYAYSKIHPNLLIKADAVVREKSKIIEFVDVDKVIIKEHYAITILKENAKPKGYFKQFYSKLMDIEKIEAIIYDKNGKRIKRIKLGDINDFSAISRASIYDDYRVKYIHPIVNSYPYTVEYSFQYKLKSAFLIPKWMAFVDYNTAIEKASCTCIVPENYDLYTDEKNIDPALISTDDDGKKIYKWIVSNYKAPAEESFSPPIESISPVVLLTPSNFELDNYPGSLDNWNEFGKFIASLNAGRDVVPEETIEEIRKSFTSGMSDREKITAIYNYSQRKNRYVNIAIGIGGWQPFPAETVDRLSYGDCKALSNYTAALLREFGYTAHYTLVQAGKHKYFDPDFIYSYFNHAFVTVPLKSDTIWLECTSSYTPAGHLGDFTDDRYALMVYENGGKLIKTPEYAVNENTQITNGTIKIEENGNGVVHYSTQYKGVGFDEQFMLTQIDETDRKKSILNAIQIPQFKLTDYDLEVQHEGHPTLTKTVNLTIFNCAPSLGHKFVLQLNTVNEFKNLPPTFRNRSTPLYIQRNYSEADTIVYELPSSFAIESLPKNISLQSEFGKYSFTTEASDNKLVYTRYFEQNKGEFPKEKYHKYIEFLEDIIQGDHSKAVLSKKN